MFTDIFDKKIYTSYTCENDKSDLFLKKLRTYARKKNINIDNSEFVNNSFNNKNPLLDIISPIENIDLFGDSEVIVKPILLTVSNKNNFFNKRYAFIKNKYDVNMINCVTQYYNVLFYNAEKQVNITHLITKEELTEYKKEMQQLLNESVDKYIEIRIINKMKVPLFNDNFQKNVNKIIEIQSILSDYYLI